MKKVNQKHGLRFIREAGIGHWKKRMSFVSVAGNLNLCKTSNAYAPYIYELWEGHSATTEAMISRHYKSVEAALLHMCNDFNEMLRYATNIKPLRRR